MYKLRKAPKRDLYWVIGADGAHKSKEPLPKEQAEAQMRALYAAMGREGEKITGGMIDVEEIRQFVADNYDEIKDLAEHVYDNRGFYYAMLRRFGGWVRGKWEDVKRFIRERMGRRGAGITIPKGKFIKEHTNLLKVLKKGNPAQLKAEYKDQAEELSKVMRGCGAMPSRALLQQIAKQSYESSPAPKIDNLTLVSATPTLKFYEAPDNTIVVGIRGTNPTDAQDLKADASIAVGQLESSKRFKSDLAALQNFQSRYSPSTYDYYGVGHSLGGAILDAFLTNGFLKNGVSYNPAVQPQNLRNADIKNERVFAENDPLYALAKPFLARAPEVRKARQKKWWEKLVSAIPYVNKVYDLYSGHQLDNFEGGGSTDFKSQLKAEGMSPASYLKKARSKAKKEGYDPKSLNFATDGVHKLEITSADGKVSRFGRVGYRDLILWLHSESPSVASMHRERFHKSHSKMRGAWKANPYSPNNLALRVLW